MRSNSGFGLGPFGDLLGALLSGAVGGESAPDDNRVRVSLPLSVENGVLIAQGGAFDVRATLIEGLFNELPIEIRAEFVDSVKEMDPTDASEVSEIVVQIERALEHSQQLDENRIGQIAELRKHLTEHETVDPNEGEIAHGHIRVPCLIGVPEDIEEAATLIGRTADALLQAFQIELAERNGWDVNENVGTATPPERLEHKFQTVRLAGEDLLENDGAEVLERAIALLQDRLDVITGDAEDDGFDRETTAEREGSETAAMT